MSTPSPPLPFGPRQALLPLSFSSAQSLCVGLLGFFRQAPAAWELVASPDPSGSPFPLLRVLDRSGSPLPLSPSLLRAEFPSLSLSAWPPGVVLGVCRQASLAELAALFMDPSDRLGWLRALGASSASPAP